MDFWKRLQRVDWLSTGVSPAVDLETLETLHLRHMRIIFPLLQRFSLSGISVSSKVYTGCFLYFELLGGVPVKKKHPVLFQSAREKPSRSMPCLWHCLPTWYLLTHLPTYLPSKEQPLTLTFQTFYQSKKTWYLANQNTKTNIESTIFYDCILSHPLSMWPKLSTLYSNFSASTVG